MKSRGNIRGRGEGLSVPTVIYYETLNSLPCFKQHAHHFVGQHTVAQPKNACTKPRVRLGVREQGSRLSWCVLKLEIRSHHQHHINVPRIGRG
jgi:hypothetical protein